MTNVPEMCLKTFCPSYKFRFEWTIDNFSDLPAGWTKDSEEFSVEPGSSWYVQFKKGKIDIWLHLCRKDAKNFKVSCETLTLNCKNETLFERKESYKNSEKKDLLTGGKYSNNILENLPEDQIFFKIYIETKNPEPCTVYGNLFRSVQVSEASLKQMKTLQGDLKRLFDEGIKTDVTFNIRGETLSAHKAILAARSEVFARMFQEGMAEEDNSVVKIEDIDLTTMKVVLSFLYSAELDECGFDAALEVYRAADKYAVTDLKDACSHVLTSKMTVENVSKLSYVADMNHHVELKEKAFQFIVTHHKLSQSELHEKS